MDGQMWTEVVQLMYYCCQSVDGSQMLDVDKVDRA